MKFPPIIFTTKSVRQGFRGAQAAGLSSLAARQTAGVFRGVEPQEDRFSASRRKRQAGRLCSPEFTGCLVVMICCLILLASPCSAADMDLLRGDQVGWARLKTTSPHWMRHSKSDPVLMSFFRENTTLNIDPTWHAADVENLAQMCAYPLLFSQGIHMVDSAKGKRNLAEYIRRGGFLLIDCCIADIITPSADMFLLQQRRELADILPDARVLPLPASHDCYHDFFQIPGGRPPHTFNANIYDPAFARHGLYGIYIGSRMCGIISLSGLQCGWDKMIAPPGHDVSCMRMLVNIYIYAMLKAG